MGFLIILLLKELDQHNGPFDAKTKTNFKCRLLWNTNRAIKTLLIGDVISLHWTQGLEQKHSGLAHGKARNVAIDICSGLSYVHIVI